MQMRCTVSLVGLVTLAVGGCNISFVSNSGGYNFDWKGDTHTRIAEGAIEPEVKEIVVQNRFGQIHIETAEGEPTWKWELKCWGHGRDEAEAWANQILMQVGTSDGQQQWALRPARPPRQAPPRRPVGPDAGCTTGRRRRHQQSIWLDHRAGHRRKTGDAK